ncbi:hypothetical protein FRC01_002178 [Tulasnella sp. 417]|nr:hypothetical protein FRC01_002178 [Tulasnella sp. 417]
MATTTSSMRPVLQQIVTVGSGRSRLASSPLVRAAPLTVHEISPIQEAFCPNDTSITPSAQLITAVPPLLTKTHRRTSSLLRQTLSPLTVCNSPLPIPAADLPPSPRTPLSPIFAALSEREEPRSAWPHIELQRAAMVWLSFNITELNYILTAARFFKEEAASRTRHLRIDPQRIRPDEDHAHSWGSFGEVWRCWLAGKTAGDLERVAVKKIHLRPEDGLSNRKLLRHLLREVVPWYELDHPNITPFIGYTFDGRSAKMLSKWQEGGNVREYMQRYPANGLRIAHQVASGLAYLHSRNPSIVHGDIKPENILIGADGVARLVDFGLSIILDDTLSRGLRTSNGCRHTLLYADPVLLDDVPRTIDTDLWALGWIIYELVTLRRPYDHRKSPSAIFGAVVARDLPTRATHDLPYPDLLWPVLDACWSPDLSRRWSAERVASHIMQAL